MTEIGRRTGIFAGATALILCLLVGLFTNSDLLMSTVFAVIGGLIFGTAGLLIGNLFDGYIAQAFRRELSKQLIERDVEVLSRKARKGKAQSYNADVTVDGEPEEEQA